MANSMDPDQTAPRAVCSGYELFASILNLTGCFTSMVNFQNQLIDVGSVVSTHCGRLYRL